MSAHKNNKFTQIDNLIPECNILSCVIKDKELNNNSYLPKLLDCRIYFATDENNTPDTIPTQFAEHKFDSTKFMNNKNRNYMIAELSPEIKTDITKLLGRVVCFSQSNPLNRKLYLEAFRLANDNYYEFMSNKFNNWYFTPDIQSKKNQYYKQNNTYIADKPRVNGIIINEPIASNYFITQFLEYLQISPAAQISNIWLLNNEKIIMSFIDCGQEFLFYYVRY